jgi:Tol biopolymer transport system component
MNQSNFAMTRVRVTFLSMLGLLLTAALLALPMLGLLDRRQAAAQSAEGTIAYVRYNDETGDEIWLVEPDGTNNRRIYSTGKPDPNGVSFIYRVAWRPDAGAIAFSSSHEGSCSLYESDIYAIHPDGSGYRRITNAPACDDLANYAKGSVRVEVQNWTGEAQMFYIYLQGASGIQAIYLPYTMKGVVTFANVADFGDGYPQFAVAIYGHARWIESAMADVQPGTTVDAAPSLYLTDIGYTEDVFTKSPTWRSDGSRLGYVFSLGALRQIEAGPPPGLYGEPLLAEEAETPLYINHLAWSPQPALADQLLYQAEEYGAAGIYRVTAGSQDPGELVLPLGTWDRVLGLAWLPDGSGFVYAMTEDYDVRSNLFAYNFASGQVTRLTDFAGEYAGYPSLSPDGQQIAFARTSDLQGAQVDLWVMNRDGSGLRLLVEDGSVPSWSLQAPVMPTSTPTPATPPIPTSTTLPTNAPPPTATVTPPPVTVTATPRPVASLTPEPISSPIATVTGSDEILYLPVTIR